MSHEVWTENTIQFIINICLWYACDMLVILFKNKIRILPKITQTAIITYHWRNLHEINVYYKSPTSIRASDLEPWLVLEV